MTHKQLRKLVRESIKAGPAITQDANGNDYLAYVIFIRNGLKYAVVTIDKDIADLNDNTEDFFMAEAVAWLEYVAPEAIAT